MKEIFRTITEFPDYEIGCFGTIISHKNNGIKKLKPWVDSKNRYLMIVLCNGTIQKKFLIHRLVGKYFVPNPDNKPVINHKDHNCKNNDYRNLEWCTIQENVIHSYSILPPDRNKRKCILIFPNGKKLNFESFAEIRRYRKEHLLDFSEHSLNYYGYSRGYKVIKL